MKRYSVTTLLFIVGQVAAFEIEDEHSRKLLFDVAASMAGVYAVSLVVLFLYLCIREVRAPGNCSDYAPPYPGIQAISTYKFPHRPNDEKAAMAGEPTSANPAINDDDDDEIGDESVDSISWRESRA